MGLGTDGEGVTELDTRHGQGGRGGNDHDESENADRCPRRVGESMSRVLGRLGSAPTPAVMEAVFTRCDDEGAGLHADDARRQAITASYSDPDYGQGLLPELSFGNASRIQGMGVRTRGATGVSAWWRTAEKRHGRGCAGSPGAPAKPSGAGDLVLRILAVAVLVAIAAAGLLILWSHR